MTTTIRGTVKFWTGAVALALISCTDLSHEPVRQTEQELNTNPPGCNAGVCEVNALISAGSKLSQFGAVATTQVQLHNRARVERLGGSPASVISAQSGGIQIGGYADLGAALSAENIQVDGGAVLHAFASAAGTITVQAGALVEGNVNPGTPLTTKEVNVVPQFTMPTTFAPGVNLEPDQTGSLGPGAYQALTIKSRAELELAAGTYFVGALNLEPQGQLKLANSSAPVEIHVLDQLNCKGDWVPDAVSSNLRIVYWGSNATDIECDLPLTTVVAPNASVRIADRKESGQVIARRVELGADSLVRAATFHSLTTGPGGKLLRDLTLQERIDSCAATQAFIGADGREAQCRLNAKNAVIEDEPANDGETTTVCTAAYDACLLDDPCAAPPEVPATCGATLSELDACRAEYLPQYIEAIDNAPSCAELSTLQAYIYRPRPSSLPDSCLGLLGCAPAL